MATSPSYPRPKSNPNREYDKAYMNSLLLGEYGADYLRLKGYGIYPEGVQEVYVSQYEIRCAKLIEILLERLMEKNNAESGIEATDADDAGNSG